MVYTKVFRFREEYLRNREAPPRPVQFFSDEYLERCRAMTPVEVLEFLESGGPV